MSADPLKEKLRSITEKCEQYWNEPGLGDAEVHAALECIHRWAREALAAHSAAPKERDGLNDAIQCAARDLPLRWRIEVVVEKNSGWTNIYDATDDYLADSVTGVSPDLNLEEQVRYLTKWALSQDKPTRAGAGP